MIVSIGILAWNEEESINPTLSSLFDQSVFSNPSENIQVSSWEIIVVANGCTDATAVVAEKYINQYCQKLEKNISISGKVIQLEEAGKSNAWNHFIHDYSAEESDYIIMMDADIVFNHADTIHNALTEIDTNSHARAVVGTPLKHFTQKEKKNIIEWMSSTYSSQKHADQKSKGDPGIAGSFYCARADILRQVWMPPGLAGEDGFLRAMIVTDFFRKQPDTKTIVRVENASHFYEGLTSLRDIFQHEVRMVIGTALNCYLCWDFLLFATDPDGQGAGHLIKAQLEHDPEWYNKLITNAVNNHGWWVLPRDMVTRRFRSINFTFNRQFYLKLLLAVLGFLTDIPVMVVANYKLKKGAVGYW